MNTQTEKYLKNYTNIKIICLKKRKYIILKQKVLKNISNKFQNLYKESIN